MEEAGDLERPRGPEARRDGAEPLGPVELLVLEAVDDVEARDPEEDREAEEDGREGEGARHRDPRPDGRDGEGEAEEEVRERR